MSQGQGQTLYMQGIAVPATAKNPQAFFEKTRRLRFNQKDLASIAGFGSTDTIAIAQTGIIAALRLHLYGTITVTPGTGTAASTARWPYDVIKQLRVSANGQSNLISCSGAKLKVREIISNGDLTDRGVSQGIGGASPGNATTQGTLSLASEQWGVGQNVTAIAAGTYDVDLSFEVPLAWDMVKLVGAIFAQTASTNLELSIDWSTKSDLFTLTGDATVSEALSLQVDGVVFAIPQVNGSPVVPDLSVFHSMTQTNDFSVGGSGSQVYLAGQGVGRQLMRVIWQLWNGAAPQTPVTLTDANFGQIGWMYGGNNTPEVFAGGRSLRQKEECDYSSDVGGPFGFAVLDFAEKWAFRDSVNEGTATNLRILLSPLVALTNPRLEYLQETIFAGAAGA